MKPFRRWSSILQGCPDCMVPAGQAWQFADNASCRGSLPAFKIMGQRRTAGIFLLFSYKKFKES